CRPVLHCSKAGEAFRARRPASMLCASIAAVYCRNIESWPSELLMNSCRSWTARDPVFCLVPHEHCAAENLSTGAMKSKLTNQPSNGEGLDYLMWFLVTGVPGPGYR